MGHNGPMAQRRKRIPIPAWLAGLLIAVALFVAILLLFSALGFGDDPVVEGMSVLVGS